MCWKLLETVLNYPKCQQLAKKLALISEPSPFLWQIACVSCKEESRENILGLETIFGAWSMPPTSIEVCLFFT